MPEEEQNYTLILTNYNNTKSSSVYLISLETCEEIIRQYEEKRMDFNKYVIHQIKIDGTMEIYREGFIGNE